MTDGIRAEDRLERLLYVLPAASREDGATLEELARALHTSEKRILEDLEQVTERAYYHSGGWPDDVSILIEPGRVRVFHASGFERPVRLSPRETLCLALALRSTAAASHVADGGRRADLLRRAERHLAALPPGAYDDRPPDPVHAGDLDPDPAGIRETLLAATRDRRACAIVYAKASADDLEVRVVHPYAILHAEGAWYVVGWCADEGGHARLPHRPDRRGRRGRRHLRGPRRLRARGVRRRPPRLPGSGRRAGARALLAEDRPLGA